MNEPVNGKDVAPECNHLFGMSRHRIINVETQETLTSWLQPLFVDKLYHAFSHWDGGWLFDFCPQCGASILDTRNAAAQHVQDELLRAMPAVTPVEQ